MKPTEGRPRARLRAPCTSMPIAYPLQLERLRRTERDPEGNRGAQRVSGGEEQAQRVAVAKRQTPDADQTGSPPGRGQTLVDDDRPPPERGCTETEPQLPGRGAARHRTPTEYPARRPRPPESRHPTLQAPRLSRTDLARLVLRSWLTWIAGRPGRSPGGLGTRHASCRNWFATELG